MVILLVTNNKNDNEFYFNRLASFTERDAVIVVDSVERAKEFIQNHLIKEGNHIDLIITNFSFKEGLSDGRDLIIWLKGREEANYFKNNLQIHSLPVVLFHTDREQTKTDYLLGFDKIILSSDSDSKKELVS